ncbi:MAG: hypothetical protein GC152_14895 [Alphaproteobacteria bacterium]|nr:hypothetical protein [Alphaproteobacteria bacterium]
MAAFRFLAWVLIALAIALLGADAVSSIETGAPVIRTTAEVLSAIGLDAAGAAAAGPKLIADGLGAILDLPLWTVFGVIGVILALIFRPIS